MAELSSQQRRCQENPFLLVSVHFEDLKFRGSEYFWDPSLLSNRVIITKMTFESRTEIKNDMSLVFPGNQGEESKFGLTKLQ